MHMPIRPATSAPDPGAILLRAGCVKEALPFLRQNLRKNPDHAHTLHNMGIAHRILAKFRKAEYYARRAVELNAELGPAWNGLGMILEDTGRFQEAQDAYASAHQLLPDNQQIAVNYAYSLMRLERFEEAWRLWEYGRRGTSWEPPAENFPVWDGSQDLTGKNLLILPEGGYGDAILFAPWLPAVRERGARIIFMTWPAMAPLFQGHPWVDEVVTEETIEWAGLHYCIPLMSVPAALGMKSLADIPQSFTPSWSVVKAKKWREEMLAAHPCRGRHVGLCWRAEENSVVRKHRTLPDAALNPLADIPGVNWYSLCPHGKDLYNRDDFTTPPWVIDLTAGFTDWGQTAACIANLDLVVTVDTAVAHLAATLGKPTWILLSCRSGWMWFVGREDSPWYPSARLFRQKHPIRWDGVIRRVAAELGKL